MNQHYVRSTGLLVIALVMNACAQIDPQPGFEETRISVNQRIGQEIHWKHGGEEDAPIREKVHALLGKPLTADTAVQIALLNNPGLQATFEGLGVAQANFVQAGLLHNPVLEAVSRSPREGGSANLEFGLSFDFLRLLTLPLRKSLAQQDYARIKLETTARVIDLSGEVRFAFHAAQASAQIVEMMKQVVTASDASLDVARRLRAAGNITALELDREQAAYEFARLQLSSAELAANSDRERLNRLLGVWGSAIRWRIDARLPELPPESDKQEPVERHAIEASLELAAERRSIDALGRRAGIENIQSFLPTLDAGVAWEREAVTDEWLNGPQISLEIPLFDMGQARRARVKSEIERAFAVYRDTAINVRSNARQAIANASSMANNWNTTLCRSAFSNYSAPNNCRSIQAFSTFRI